MRNWQINLLMAAVPLVLPVGGRAQIPEGWEIREITPPGTEFADGHPDINDRGQIVFSRWRWPDQNAIEIMLYDRGRLIQLTDDDVPDNFPTINIHGDIAWSRDLDPDPTVRRFGIARWRDGDLEILAEPKGAHVLVAPDINDAGPIVWNCTPLKPPNTADVYLFDGESVRRMTDDRFSNQGAYINEYDDFVYTQYDFSVAPWVSAVVAYFDGASQPLTPRSAAFVTGGLNDLSWVVWDSSFIGPVLWQDGMATVLLAENAIAQGVNNCGHVPITRFDPIEQNTMQWLWRNGELLQLTDAVRGGGLAEINERGEVVFVTGRDPFLGISVFTKPAFVVDADFDGDVDLSDFAALQACFDARPGLGDEACLACDNNNDGIVNLDDLAQLLEHFGGPVSDHEMCNPLDHNLRKGVQPWRGDQANHLPWGLRCRVWCWRRQRRARRVTPSSRTVGAGPTRTCGATQEIGAAI